MQLPQYLFWRLGKEKNGSVKYIHYSALSEHRLPMVTVSAGVTTTQTRLLLGLAMWKNPAGGIPIFLSPKLRDFHRKKPSVCLNFLQFCLHCQSFKIVSCSLQLNAQGGEGFSLFFLQSQNANRPKATKVTVLFLNVYAAEFHRMQWCLLQHTGVSNFS